MANAFALSAQARAPKGTGHCRRMRRLEDRIPAIIYGGNEDTQPISLAHKDVMKALENEGFYSHILTIDVDGKPLKAVLKALQRHPYKTKVLHMDFQRITGSEIISMRVPLHFLGENVAPGVKRDGGIVSHNMIDVEIHCPADKLPEYIEVDLSNLEVDQTVHLSDLKLPADVTIPALAQGTDHDLPVASIQLPRSAAIADETEEGTGGESDSNTETK
ncbi:MAG: 50S ribosomal protein L25/general stress protein Ctc [Gammaproteobacteria bacterium]